MEMLKEWQCQKTQYAKFKKSTLANAQKANFLFSVKYGCTLFLKTQTLSCQI